MEEFLKTGAVSVSLCLSGVLFFSVSLLFYFRKQNTFYAVTALVISGILIRCGMSFFDPWLNGWDEVYHALVAKNMTRHFFTPTLYDAPLFKLSNYWVGCEYWLHKPPLFLWQMALSMKIFGCNVIAARLPSALLSGFAVYFMFDIGRRMVDEKAGYFAAVIYCLAYYPLELACGAACNDHNDTSFVFYITASLWAWLRYQNKPTLTNALLIGLFSGIAIMVKWLAGLLVFSGWGITVLLNKEKNRTLLPYLHMLLALMVAAAVVVPWQVYIFRAFPAQAEYEWELISTHFTQVVEDHGGPWYYHLTQIPLLYPSFGKATPYVLLVCLLLLLTRMPVREHKLFTIVCVLTTYIFFSAAATKMLTFCFIISPFVYLAAGTTLAIISDAWDRTRWKSITLLLLLFTSYRFLDLPTVYTDHFANNKYDVSRQYVESIQALEKKFDPEKEVLFNVHFYHAAEIQFFTDFKCYSFVPLPEMFDKLDSLQITPVIIEEGNSPEYARNRSGVIFIPPPWNASNY